MSEEAGAGGRSRIEGGVDAIVVGGGPDGLVAAAYLARSGRRTVIFESTGELGLPVRKREMGARRFAGASDGEHLIHALDPHVIDDLDLYRHGVSYASRRLETTYIFKTGERLTLRGDLREPMHDLEDTADALGRFATGMFAAAAQLRPLTSGAAGGAQEIANALSGDVSEFPGGAGAALIQSAEDVFDRYFAEGPLRDALTAEAAFRSALPPHEQSSFSQLLARWAGEVSGLQGAVGYPEGGAVAIVEALRRSAQRTGVDIRASTEVTEILIEKDAAAGVVLSDGGQVRAPIVVSALDAHTTYMSLIGPEALDVAFQRDIAMRRAPIATVQLHVVLADAPDDEDARGELSRRLVYAPPPDDVRRAFSATRRGEIPNDLIIEAIAVDAFEEEWPEGKMQLSVLAHPLPLDADANEQRREETRAAIVASLEKMLPGAGERIEDDALVTPHDLAGRGGGALHAFSAREGLLRQLSLAAVTRSACNIGGLYFCGPEAQLGYGLNGAAGRAAARAALKKAKRSGAAP